MSADEDVTFHEETIEERIVSDIRKRVANSAREWISVIESAHGAVFKELTRLRHHIEFCEDNDDQRSDYLRSLHFIETELLDGAEPGRLEGQIAYAAIQDLDPIKKFIAAEFAEAARLKKDLSARPVHKIDSRSDPVVRQRVRDLTDGRCVYCESELGDEWHVDHMVPHSQGGPDNFTNYVPACKSCNTTKHARHVVEFIRNGKRYWPKPWEVKDVGTATAPAAPDTFSYNGDGELPEAAE